MRKKGFTLIELVMVIVIIGILAGIAIPRFINIRRDAQQAACDANVGAIRAAITNFYARSAMTGTDHFPGSLHSAGFLSVYLQGNTLPICSEATDYNTLYSSNTGVLRTHTHP